MQRCLQKDSRSRLRDIGEARIILDDPQASVAMRIASGESPAPEAGRRRVWPIVAAAVLALILGLAGGRILNRPAPASEPPAFLFDIQDTTGKLITGSLALSPNGVHLVFAQRDSLGNQELFLRRMDEAEARLLPGTKGGGQPFWSADGLNIGFFIGDTAYRVGLDGSAATPIASIDSHPRGGSWNDQDVILVGSSAGPIYRMTASGGEIEAVTTIEEGVEDTHVWPAFLPDGEHFVFLADAATDEGHRLYVVSLDGKEKKILRKSIRSAIFVDPAGALLFINNRQLFALPFDFGRREITGPQVLIEDEVQAIGQNHESPVTISANGIMALQRGSDESAIMRVPLDGSAGEVVSAPDRYRNPRISPDGHKLAFEIQTSGKERLIWVEDIDRGSRTLISEKGRLADSAVWSADNEWVYFGSSGADEWNGYRKRVQGGAPPELLGIPEGGTDLAILDCSRDGRWLLIGCNFPGGYGLYLGRLGEGDVTWTEWLNTPASEQFARFSPDTRWIAFQSDVSGQDEIYIAPLEGGAELAQWMVSVNGGSDPAWSPDGSRLYYRSPNETLMEVALRVVGDQIEADPPASLFELRSPNVGYLRNVYDPHPEGSSVVAAVEVGGKSSAIRVRTGWRQW